MNKKYNQITFVILLSSFLISKTIYAQKNDTLKIDTLKLKEIIILENKSLGTDRMSDLKENTIYAGKKTEVIQLDKINADLSSSNTRQVFAKIPGISIWENDASGLQVGIAARGLSPNRSWEFNVRQNGYDVSSESFGYPEAYYAPPMEAVEKIEVTRGAASLQFGPQFGGLINYQIKQGNQSKPFGFEHVQTYGSYGFYNVFNSIGGTYKKLNYYSYLHKREADGWRENSYFSSLAAYIGIKYQLTNKIEIKADYSKSDYKNQQSGGLTDKQFEENHRASNRNRNWFGAPWNIASLTINYKVNSKLNFQIKSFGIIAERNSVGYLKAMTLNDSINPVTLAYNNRQIDRDNYANLGAEFRMSYIYSLFNENSTFAGGLRVYEGITKRNQIGIGSTGTDFDLTLTTNSYGKNYDFATKNLAFFAENIFKLGKKFKIIPGIRYENLENSIKGFSTSTGNIDLQKRKRNFLLYGIGSEVLLTKNIKWYANYSKAYRPITFSELTPSATTEKIDENLKDASGFNFDTGIKGNIKNYVNFDIGVFYLDYANRIGVITVDDGTLKTNIGKSVSKGLESYIELDVFKIIFNNKNYGSLTLFSSNTFIKAEYTEWNNDLIKNDPAKSIENKKVENAPEFIHRFGSTYSFRGLSLTLQYNKTGSVFTDAQNTLIPNSTGTTGKIEGYEVVDLTIMYQFLKRYKIKVGANNLMNEKYATRRATGYPGPGLISGNARNVFISLGINF